MGILDDIKNMKPVSDKVFTVKHIKKLIYKMPFSGKGNKIIKRYRGGQVNYQVNKVEQDGDDERRNIVR